MGIFGTLGKIAGGVGGFLLGGPAGAAAGYGLANSIGKEAKANKLNQQVAQYANDRFAAGAPYRSKLAEVALNLPTQRPDLSGIYADPGNPYARPVSRLTAAAFRPAPAPPPVAQPPAQDPGMERMLASMPGRMRSAMATRAFGGGAGGMR